MDLDDDLVSNAPSGGTNVPLDDFENVAGGLGGETSTVAVGSNVLMPEEDDDDDSSGGGVSDDEGGGEEEEDNTSSSSGGGDGDDDDANEDMGGRGPSKRRRFDFGDEEDLEDEDGDDGSSSDEEGEGEGGEEEEIPTGGFGAGMGRPAANKYADMTPEEIQQLKLDLLFKMGVLHQAGYKSPREYSVDDTLQTIQIELQRLQTAEDMAYGLEMCRWGVVNGVSVLESMNEGLKLTPLKLKGWSATVHRRQHTLDPILLELYQTYFYKVHLGPFTKLSMALGLAAVNTHMANTVRANIESGEPGDPSAGGMPGFANVIGSMMSNFRPPMRGGGGSSGGGSGGGFPQQGNMAGPSPM